MKYFYIIQRGGIIHEVGYEPEKYRKIFREWQKGGLIIVTTKTGETFGVNAVDIVNIFSEEKYDEYIHTSKIKRYIRNGSWYDAKEHKLIKHSEWKQKEIDTRPKLEDVHIQSLSQQQVKEKIKQISIELKNKLAK